MRVITGKAKGHRLKAPKSNRTRPALDQVKEAIFNILFDVKDLAVLDLFAGCGSIGIEAISRGARSCTFVENWKNAADCIVENLRHCKLEEQAKVIRMDVDKAIEYLSRKSVKFDIIFVDPPYEKELVNPTLSQLASSNLIHEGSIIIVEHHPKEPIEAPESLILTDCRKYGQTRISFLRTS